MEETAADLVSRRGASGGCVSCRAMEAIRVVSSHAPRAYRLKVIEMLSERRVGEVQVMLEHFTFLAIAHKELADQVEHIERQEVPRSFGPLILTARLCPTATA